MMTRTFREFITLSADGQAVCDRLEALLDEMDKLREDMRELRKTTNRFRLEVKDATLAAAKDRAIRSD